LVIDTKSRKSIFKFQAHILLEYSLPLIFGVVCGLVWSNFHIESYNKFISYSFIAGSTRFDIRFWLNEVFMSFFFGLATKEIVESTLPGGVLNPLKRAINPLIATIGGVLGPIFVYLITANFFEADSIIKGWAIPTATDIALAWLCARILLGSSHPAINYLLLLAIVDDGIGLAIICIFYPDPYHVPRPIFLFLVVVAMAWAWWLRRSRTSNHWTYICGPGLLSWIGLYKSNLHPALALVPIIPFFPHAESDLGIYSYDKPSEVDALGQFDRDIRAIVEFGLFGFGIVNAGVPLSAVGISTLAVVLGLVIGKPLGIFSFGWLARRNGFDLPLGMGYRELLIVGTIAGLGLTVSLFISTVAFTDPHIQAEAKMGALLSLISVFVAYVLVRVFKT
jgi:NhaA family Na+:H+ antiporter